MGKAKKVSVLDVLESIANGIQTQSNLTYEPHPKQKTFHCSDMHEKLFIGGNRSGKTIASVNECIWRCTKTHPFRPELNEIQEPVRGRLVCVSFIDGLEKIILPLFKKWVPVTELVDYSWEASYNSYKKVLTFKNGSYIEFMSYDQEVEKFAGTSRHFVAFDEEPPMTIWQECKLRLLDTEGDWWISMTPVEGMTWIYFEVYEKWKKGERPYTLVVEVNTDENPHLSEAGKRIAFGDLSDEDRATRKAGGFNEYSGIIYKDFSREVHVRKAFVPAPQDYPQIYTSLDTGFRHPAVWLWHAVYPDGRIITFHEISEAEKTVTELAAEVHEFERKVLVPAGFNQRDIIRTGDPNGLPQTKEHTGTSVQNEYAMQDLFIGTNIPRDVDIGIIRVTQYLKARTTDEEAVWTVTEDCPALIAGMERYRWDEYESKKMQYKNGKKKVPKKKDDDEVDSLRYFFVVMPELISGRIKVTRKLSSSEVSAAFRGHGGVDFSPVGALYDTELTTPTSKPRYFMEG